MSSTRGGRTKAARKNKNASKQIPLARVFIASASESTEIAERLQILLDETAYTTLWTQFAFTINESYLDSLIDATEKYDFFVVIFGADDRTNSRGKVFLTPRDNVVLEAGLFLSKRGKDRTFIIAPKHVKFPSDLHGLHYFTYSVDHPDLLSALGPTATKIKSHIQTVISKEESLAVIPPPSETALVSSHLLFVELVSGILDGTVDETIIEDAVHNSAITFREYSILKDVIIRCG